MAKKLQNHVEKIALDEPYYLATIFKDRVVVPMEAIDPRFFEIKVPSDDFGRQTLQKVKFITKDNKQVTANFVSILNIKSEWCLGYLNAMCNRLYGKDFEYVKSVWIARLNNAIIEYWAVLTLKEV